MEQFIIDQIKYGLKYIPVNLLKYPFIKKETDETKAFRSKGFMCGVCHPSDDTEQMKNANIRWVRVDTPFPFDDNWAPSKSYEEFKERCKMFTDNGMKVMVVTPYPREYFNRGLDVRTPEGEKKLREVARLLINDFQGIAHGFQITNEMGIPHFTLPLENLDEAARYIGIQLEEMYPLKNDILLGYNCAGTGSDLHFRMKPYWKFCDYIGIDIYMGCFFPGFMWVFDALINYTYAMTKKPVILMEFGYISKGAPKTKQQKTEILKKYGAKNEADAKANIVKFVSNLPEYMQKHIKNVCKNDESRYFNLIFKSDYKTHLYKELPKTTVIPGYPHTYEGQARFYSNIIPELYKKSCLAGTFIYSYSDASACHVCGQTDCPTETQWGLTKRDGTMKPSYYAVKEAFSKIIK